MHCRDLEAGVWSRVRRRGPGVWAGRAGEGCALVGVWASATDLRVALLGESTAALRRLDLRAANTNTTLRTNPAAQLERKKNSKRRLS